MPSVKDKLGNAWHKEEERQRRLAEGVAGAHLCIPFQCGVCWMRNMEGRDPNGNDECNLACVKRANLDAMAGKLPITIGALLMVKVRLLEVSLYARGPRKGNVCHDVAFPRGNT